MSTHYIEEAERLADTVTIMSHGKAVAVGRAARADRRARRRARRSRSTGRRRGWPRSRREARAAAAAARAAPARRSSILARRTAQRRTPEGERRADEPRGRLRAADRGGDRVMAAARHAPRSAGSSAPRSRACWCARSSTSRRSGARRRSRRPSSRRSTCSRSASASARWSRTVAGYDYVDFVGTGTVATAVLFSSRLPGDVRDVRQVQVPAHLRRDPRRAGRHRGARHRRGAVDRARAPASTAACRCSWRWSSGSTRAGGCCSCPFIGALAGFGWACFGIFDRRAC